MKIILGIIIGIFLGIIFSIGTTLYSLTNSNQVGQQQDSFRCTDREQEQVTFHTSRDTH